MLLGTLAGLRDPETVKNPESESRILDVSRKNNDLELVATVQTCLSCVRDVTLGVSNSSGPAARERPNKDRLGHRSAYGHFSHRDPTNQDPLTLNYEKVALRNLTVH